MFIVSDVVAVGEVEFVTLTLQPISSRQVVALAALSTQPDEARVFFNQAARRDGFFNDKSEHPSVAYRILALRGDTGLYIDLPVSGLPKEITLFYEGKPLIIALSKPMPDLMAGHDCLLTTINQALSIPVNADDNAFNPTADPDYMCQWLDHHARYQGVTAAFVLNRLGPNMEGADFSKRLHTAFEKAKIGKLKQIVVLDVPVPTGRLNEGDERHLWYAPDAPGKNRMEQPAPDPWRSAFGDEVLLEFLRDAFFSRAMGVAYLDMSDWLAPTLPGVGSVFEAARSAKPDPIISLNGLRAFAWKLPNNGDVAPGDHICQPFDFKAGFSRWAYSPALGSERKQTWRPHRIIGLEHSPAPQQRLWRFAGMRHPGAAPSQVAPKSSLREHSELISFSVETLGYKPFRVPETKIDAGVIGVPAATRGNKIVLVTAMKNEGPFLLEWIAYHRAIGVSDFIVFTNDCTDGTDALLDLLAARGIVEHYSNPFKEMNLKPQHAGFRAAEKMPTVQNADWLMTADVDEFINVHVGDGHLHDLFTAVGDANMISCTWRLFGNSDLATYDDGFLLAQFTRCAAISAARPHQAWGFKTLYQNNGIFRKLGVHRPKGLYGDAVPHLNWVNGSGKPMPKKEYRNGWRSTTDTIGYNLVSLNHYAVRSTESFLVKRDRGRVNHVDRDQGSAYWFRMNHNTTEDHSIQRMIPALQAEWDVLTADPKIMASHNYCVERHRAKITDLKAKPEPVSFFNTLNSNRYQALSRMLPAFGSNVFLAGPESIPQDLVDKFSSESLPDDFFFTVERSEETKH
jgi:hypothetical protein